MSQQGFEVKKEIIIDVPAAELWEMVGPGFTDVHKWSSNVDHAEGSGTPEFEGAVCSNRSCDLNVKGFNKISEKLFLYDQNKMMLGYSVEEGMPGFVTKAKNIWTVEAVNDKQSKLTMNAEFGSKGFMGMIMQGMMKKKMTETLETVLIDAKVYAETGEISATKKERIKELAEKAEKKAA